MEWILTPPAENYVLERLMAEPNILGMALAAYSMKADALQRAPNGDPIYLDRAKIIVRGATQLLKNLIVHRYNVLRGEINDTDCTLLSHESPYPAKTGTDVLLNQLLPVLEKSRPIVEGSPFMPDSLAMVNERERQRIVDLIDHIVVKKLTEVEPSVSAAVEKTELSETFEWAMPPDLFRFSRPIINRPVMKAVYADKCCILGPALKAFLATAAKEEDAPHPDRQKIFAVQSAHNRICHDLDQLINARCTDMRLGGIKARGMPNQTKACLDRINTTLEENWHHINHGELSIPSAWLRKIDNKRLVALIDQNLAAIRNASPNDFNPSYAETKKMRGSFVEKYASGEQAMAQRA